MTVTLSDVAIGRTYDLTFTDGTEAAGLVVYAGRTPSDDAGDPLPPSKTTYVAADLDFNVRSFTLGEIATITESAEQRNLNRVIDVLNGRAA